MCGRYCYYTHRIMSEWFPKEYLSIIHDKIEKTNTSIPRLHVKSKSIVGTNLGLSLIGMIIHGHTKRGFGHFSLPSVHMGTQFTITSFEKILRDLEDRHLDMFGDFNYESGSYRNPLSNELYKIAFTLNVECTRMDFYLMED